MGNMCGKPPTTFEQCYSIAGEIGKGGTATVYLGQSRGRGHLSPPKFTFVAVKVVDKSKFTKEEAEILLQEAVFLAELGHPNIVRLWGFFDPPRSRTAALVLENVDGGELFDRVARKSTYAEVEARELARCLLKALEHLESHRIAHRDIKVRHQS